MGRVWVLEFDPGQMDYARLGLFASVDAVIEDLPMVMGRVRDMATRHGLTIGVDVEKSTFWADNGDDRLELSPEMVYPVMPSERMSGRYANDVIELRRLMGLVMTSMTSGSVYNEGTQDDRPIVGTWKFVSDETEIDL